MWMKLTTSAMLAVAVLVAPPAGAAGIDLHRMWDDRCAGCHGHAGDFARKLTVSGGELQGRHHVHDLRLFLRNHYPADSEVDAVYDMLLAQASSAARFRAECSSCHGTAAEFVRDTLALRDGELLGRESGRPVHLFLGAHRQLGAADASFFAQLLKRVAGEVFRP